MLLNRYRVEEQLGHGGGGTVYAVTDTLRNDARIALKALWPDRHHDALVAVLRSEFRVMAALRHARLGRVFDFGRLPVGAELPGAPDGARERGGFFLTRELIDGEPLNVAIERRGADPAHICRALAQAARLLDMLHRAGMRHGDFKPANCIVDHAGALHLIDFGLTQDEHSHVTAGTLPYLAPEVLGRRSVDRRADLYALGIALYELCAGERPSGNLRGADLISWHLASSRPKLPAPEPIARLCARLISRDPDDRLPTAAEVGAALTACAGDQWQPDEPNIVAPVPRRQLVELEQALTRRTRGAGGPARIDLVGTAGAGKVAALTELSWRAQLAGCEVVRVTDCVPLERCFAQLAAVSQRPLPTAPKASAPPLAHHAALTTWLEEVSARYPVLLCVDDGEREDVRGTVEYLGHALSASARVLIVTGTRTAAEGAQAVPLPALTTAQVDDLIAAAAGRRDRALAARVREHTAGNPLHVIDTLKALGRRGFPPAQSLEELGLPREIDEVLSAELDQLTAPQRASLYALAVLGTIARTGLVSRVAKLETEEPLRAAEARGLVLRGADGSYAFTRAAIRQACLERLDQAQRRQLHSDCARALAELGADYADYALHDLRAGHTDRLPEALEVADQRFQARDDTAARHLYQEILQLAERDGERALARTTALKLGELARRSGNPAAAIPVLAPLAEAGDDQAAVTLAQALADGDQAERAELLLTRAITSDDEAIAMRAACDLARLHIKRGRSADAIAVASQGLERAPQSSCADELRAACAFSRGMLGDDDRAEQELAEIAERARSRDRTFEATALNYEAVLAFRRGDYHRAGERYGQALQVATEVGDVARIGSLRMNLASLAFHDGRYGQSHTHLSAAVSLLRAAGAESLSVFARRNYGHALLELGEYEQARAELRGTMKSAQRLGLDSPRAGCHQLLGIATARTGELVAARARFEAAAQLFEQIGDQRAVADTMLDLAEALTECAQSEGDLADARAALQRAQQLDGTARDPARGARRHAIEALLAAAHGDSEAASTALANLTAEMQPLAGTGGRHLQWTLHAAAERAATCAGDPAAAATERAAAVSILQQMAADLSAGQLTAFWRDPRRRRLRSAWVPIAFTATANPTVTPTGIPAGNADTAPSPSVPYASERLYRLLEIYRRMSSEQDLNRLLELVMDTAVDLSGAERGFLLVRPADGGELQLAVTRNLPSAMVRAVETSVPGSVAADADPQGDGYSRTIAQRVFESGEPVVSDSARDDPRFDGAESVHALDLGSVLCIPVRARGQVVGALYMESRYLRRRFDDNDLRLLQAFGDQVAIALENARLLEENRSRATELEQANHQIELLLAERTEQLSAVKHDLERTRRRLLTTSASFGIVGQTPAMERVFHLIDRARTATVPVSIRGESGTGKELVARALHEYGPRKDKRMVSVNCGALPEQLLASELFGHVRGAFTGADRTREGLFQVAHGGTLFLDEVGDTPERMQATLLRALQERTIRPVGGTHDIAVDVRLVTATNRRLEDLVTEGTFREDLYYRLQVLEIVIPPLRERRDDIPLLAEHFLALIAKRTNGDRKGITRRAMRALMDYDWPGNVRQLEHALTNAGVMADGPVLDLGDFSFGPATASSAESPSAGDTPDHSEERARILAALQECGGNKSQAARKLGIPRRTFYRRLAEHDIQ